MAEMLDVKRGVLHTWEGEEVVVEGGAYLAPDSVLSTRNELERLREKVRAPAHFPTTPVVLGAALVGLAFGYWLGTRDDD